MIKEIIDAIVAISFCLTITFGAKEVYIFVKKETAKLLQRGQNDLSDFNRGLTKRDYNWEKE